MKDKKPVEAEKGEIIIRNSNDDIAIIPKEMYSEVTKLINDGDHVAIDEIVNDLPSYNNYAEDGTVIINKDDDKRSFAVFMNKTEQPWSKAFDNKLTDGTYQSNTTLVEKINNNEINKDMFKDEPTPDNEIEKDDKVIKEAIVEEVVEDEANKEVIGENLEDVTKINKD